MGLKLMQMKEKLHQIMQKGYYKTASGKIDGTEFKKEYNNIVKNANAIIKNPMITRSLKVKKKSRNFITVDRNCKA